MIKSLVVWLDPGGRVYHVAGCPTLAEKVPVVPYDARRDHWRNPCRRCKPDAQDPLDVSADRPHPRLMSLL